MNDGVKPFNSIGSQEKNNTLEEFSMARVDFPEIARSLDLGDEYFLSPERLVPFEHWIGHIPFVFWLMKIMRPERFIELGTHRGNSYCAMCQAVEEFRLNAVGVAVDTWEGDIHMQRGGSIFEELKAYHDPRYGSFSTLLRATFDEAQTRFIDGSVDLLHINGAHTYEAVRHDFEFWLPKLSSRSIVLFHDIEVRQGSFGVWRLWDELRQRYPGFAFAHSHGLGVLAVGENQPAPMRSLLNMSLASGDAAIAQRIFSTRGAAIVDHFFRQQLAASNHEVEAELARQREEGNKAIVDATARLSASDARGSTLERSNQELRQRITTVQRTADAQIKAFKLAADDALHQLAAANNTNRQVLASLNAIESSATWRATAPIRKILTRHPRLALYGRRAAKVMWWTLTGQLPSRIRARRNAIDATQPHEKNADFQPPLKPKHSFHIVPRYIDPAVSAKKPELPVDCRVAIHLHIFYFDLVDEFVERFKGIPGRFDVFVSVPDSATSLQLAQTEKSIRDGVSGANSVVIRSVPNRGRDIAPFIVEFGRVLLDYQIIGHFHTKKSPHNSRLLGWRNTMLDLLLGPAGSPGGQVGAIFEMLQGEAKIVFPEAALGIPREPTGWAGNHAIAKEILAKYTKTSIEDYPVVEFAEGTMLWGRSDAFSQFLSLPLGYEDFPLEPIGSDGSIAHALERLTFILANEVSGKLIRLHKGDSYQDSRLYEESQDFSKKLAHSDVKILSYYLPQFHPTPENDEWHGVGFTEWTKVRAANPLFFGHYQQHIPHPDFGYYLLDDEKTLRRQALDMKRAGVHGQIFYHYWFTGKLILEHPAQMLLKSPDIAMPFCFCWANENWTRRWDGSEDQILLKQDYSAEDARAFIRYLIPFFKDSRYIKIDGRPVLFVYRATLIPDVSTYLNIWREECENASLQAPYVVLTLASGATDPRAFGMDAGVERVLYDWTNGEVPEITSTVDAYVPLKGRVFSYESMKHHYAKQASHTEFPYFRSLVPNWDNTARYGDRAHVLHGSTPELFQEWLETLIAETKKTLPSDRRFIVVNAWNEWAEGAHLEADTRYGYAYLNAIGRALSNEPYIRPVGDSLRALEIASASNDAKNAGAIMMVAHRWGGGTDRHVSDMVNALLKEGVIVFLTRTSTQRPNWAVVERVMKSGAVELETFNLEAAPDSYAHFISRLNIKHLHVQHLAGFPEFTSDWIQQACQLAAISYDVTLHDYMAVCPRIVMIAEANKYCGEPPLRQCEICIAKNGSPFGHPSVAQWRSRYTRLLNGARRCFVPNEDVAERASRYFPRVTFTVRPHPEPRRNDIRLRTSKFDRTAEAWSGGNKETHVAVIGYIAGHKGLDILLECAKFAQSERLPIRFTIIGTTDLDSAFATLDNVAILGRYEPAKLLEIIERVSPDVAFFPSSCPETYSYALSEAIAAGIYPIVFDIGAMARRVRSMSWGGVLPLGWMNDPGQVVQALINARPTEPTPAVYELARGKEYGGLLTNYYDIDLKVESVPPKKKAEKSNSVEAYLEEIDFSKPNREAVLYVTYSPDGLLKPHVQRCVSAFAKAGVDVYVIVAADLPKHARNLVSLKDVSGVFVRQNCGYDFAAWAQVFLRHPEFLRLDILYFANDSVIGPFDDAEFLLAISRVREGRADIYGMTENFEQKWHLQSYFLAIKKSAMQSSVFMEFMESIENLEAKQAVIDCYEIPFGSKMSEAGFEVEALYPLPSERNTTLFHWRELTQEGFPFVKIQAARDKIEGIEREGVLQFLRDVGCSSEELNSIGGR